MIELYDLMLSQLQQNIQKMSYYRHRFKIKINNTSLVYAWPSLYPRLRLPVYVPLHSGTVLSPRYLSFIPLHHRNLHRSRHRLILMQPLRQLHGALQDAHRCSSPQLRARGSHWDCSGYGRRHCSPELPGDNFQKAPERAYIAG